MITKADEIDAYLNGEAYRVEHETGRMLARLGEECVNEARDRPPEESWNDQTGNLRSSIGYELAIDGKPVITSAFPVVLGGQEGSSKGKSAVRELAKKNETEYTLKVVAGMEYADKVEAMDNKVVLASAELMARKILPEYLKNLIRKLKL
jgi:hypothetical protein